MASPLVIFITLCIVALFLLILALYFIPIEITGTFGYYETMVATILTKWGAISFQFLQAETGEIRFLLFNHVVYKSAITPEKKEEKEEKKGEEEEKPSKIPVQPQKILNAWPFLKKVLLTIYKSFVLRSVSCDVRLGFGNPATTGLMYGYFWALKGILSPVDKVRLSMVPSFDREIIEGKTALNLLIRRPLIILYSFAWAITKKPVRELLRTGDNT
jgi:hypothetical protein